MSIAPVDSTVCIGIWLMTVGGQEGGKDSAGQAGGQAGRHRNAEERRH